MSTNEKILLVEDDKSISVLISTILTYHKYEVIHTASGEMAINLAASHAPDAILLDLGLPDLDGMHVLKRIREWTDTPILIVSAHREESQIVAALDSGANDYITKPFGVQELLARIRAAMRVHRKTSNINTPSTFINGELLVDYEKHLISMRNKPVHLTPIEYKILTLFSQNIGKVLTHDYMLECVWGPYAGESQVLRVNIANIRRKLEKNAAKPAYILTEVGIGYRMPHVTAEQA